MYINNSIFYSIEELKEFLLDNKILTNSVICKKCQNEMNLTIYCKKFLIYRCKNGKCKCRKSITSSKIHVCSLLQIFYLILTGATYKQLELWHGLAQATIWKYRKELRKAYKMYMSKRPVLVGGLDVVVEIDETVLCRRKVIRNPTTTDDYAQDTVWIVGAVDNTPNKNFLLKRVENRRIETLTNDLEGLIHVGSMLRSDGHPSYPSFAANLHCSHSVVNHTNGFINEEGIHTNNIEAFWSHLKSSMRKENGVKRANIDVWLDEYTFKRRYLMNLDSKELGDMFIELVGYLLNE